MHVLVATLGQRGKAKECSTRGASLDDPAGGPHPGQPDPREPIGPLKLRPVRRPLVDGQLPPQGQVLEGELTVAATEEPEESELMEQECDHRA